MSHMSFLFALNKILEIKPISIITKEDKHTPCAYTEVGKSLSESEEGKGNISI